MDRYIATKPVRFDRDYAVGEEIPGEIIDSKMIKRLVEWGKIQQIPEVKAAVGDTKKTPVTGEQINDDLPPVVTEPPDESNGDENDESPSDDDTEPATDTEETNTNPDLICPVCGKVCGNKPALAMHMKTHDQN